MTLGIVLVKILCLAFFSEFALECSAHPRMAPPARNPVVHSGRTTSPIVGGDDYKDDVDQLMTLRSHPLDELIAFANRLEAKWRLRNWNQYADIMKYVCSEISNRGLNDPKVREASEHFARVALSHSSQYRWEHEAAVVGWLGYQRSASDNNTWLKERSEKAELWLRAWQRLERQTDANFDINDRKNQPLMRVSPPPETGLPAGTPPAAIKDARLRAKYEAAIVENNRKSEKVDQQLPLRLHGPSFKARAERWLIQAYSQAPGRTTELNRYLNVYIRDVKTRHRILGEVRKNTTTQTRPSLVSIMRVGWRQKIY